MLFRLSILSIITGLVLFSVYLSEAAVKGQCSNCHTMHNSQAGTFMADSASPRPNLLVDSCVGCHTSSISNETIKTLGSSKIPIVLNTSGYPTQPLAGGNFYNVSLGGPTNDVFGHNVLGISGVDANLSSGAPGDGAGCGLAQSCHGSLAIETSPSVIYGSSGCQGCHQSTKHHGTGSPNTEEVGWYRFLSGHPWLAPALDVAVKGVEDPDWEQNPSTGHNTYKGYTAFYLGAAGGTAGLGETNSITAFCRGCHSNFHSAMTSGGSMVSPWLKHPSDAALPTTGDYAAYASYNTQIPVAYVNPDVPVRAEAVVMCLTCHRAHGSEYPNMLRWDYRNWPSAGFDGCGVCHSTKN